MGKNVIAWACALALGACGADERTTVDADATATTTATDTATTTATDSATTTATDSATTTATAPDSAPATDTAPAPDTTTTPDTTTAPDTTTTPDTTTATDAASDVIAPTGPDRSLRFFGNATINVDRVTIAIDIGASDFTLELWLRGRTADNPQPARACDGDAWTHGNVVVAGDQAFGLALLGGALAFGTSLGTHHTVCGDTLVLDDAWHHIAVQRDNDGHVELYVDGALDASGDGSAGDLGGAELVVGASFAGSVDELRLSNVRRYDAAFTRPSARFPVDADTAALYHFDALEGPDEFDAVGASPGVRRFGGSPPGPIAQDDTPFNPAPAGVGPVLPSHRALRVMVISDGVNPNNLTHAELTEPGDLSAAFDDPQSGLHLAAPVTEVSSQCIDDAMTALAGTDLDVVVYFAHRDARRCDTTEVQADFTSTLGAWIAAGGGLVVFHHGLYQWESKNDVLALIGGSASAYAWDPNGQRVIDAAPGHFITSNGVRYTDGDSFMNTPDERYPNYSLLPDAGSTLEVLFQSDYGGGDPILAHTKTRADWLGRVATYQPGEYQPNILDRDGPNFQILVNEILWAARAEP